MTPEQLATFLREEVPQYRAYVERTYNAANLLKIQKLLGALDAAMGLLRETRDHLETDHNGQTEGCRGCVALGTLGRGKIGYGGDAPKWFQAGLWAKVANYCVDDVALERDLGAFIDRFGYVVNGKTSQVVEIPKWETGGAGQE